jgi:hypothetical protein
MSGKGIKWLLFFLSMLFILMGCGRKGPPTLPEKSSSLIILKGAEYSAFRLL